VINHFRSGELQLEWELPSCHHQKPISSPDESEAATIREIIWRRLSSLYIDVPTLRPGTVGAYALAIVSAGVATALRVALDPYLTGAQFITFFPAIVITSLISGFGAGFFCAVLSTAAADFFVLEPRWSFYLDDPAAVADLLLFGPLAFFCVFLIGRMRLAIEHEQAERALERKKREEREFHIREINHRAKNMLSIVDAIAHQTATRNPENFIERFSERIRALSANQDLLIRSEWNGVEIADLVRAQLTLFADLIGSRIAVQGPKVRLRTASAQAIGLALHELATNAGKYGAFSTDTGRVDVNWRTDGDTFNLSWTEHDGPPVSAPERRGFGTILMETMADFVDGAVDLDYAPSGLTWRLTCPAANALEPVGPVCA
jgi:two-component sensor histidine kinase